MSEHKCIVPQCCCCCTLRTGTITLGVLNLIAALLNIGLMGVGISQGLTAAWFGLIVYIFVAIIAIILLNGVRTMNAKHVKVWVYATLVLLVLMIISGIVNVINTRVYTELIGTFIVAALNLYFIVVVRSYGFELEAGGGGPNTV